jgi:hypothetical protein
MTATARRPLTEGECEQRSEWMRAAWAGGRFDGRRKGMHPRKWTARQNDALKRLVGTVPIDEVADKLNAEFKTTRTAIAVASQVTRLGLSRWVQAYSLIEIERVFGWDHRVIVKHWVTPGHLVGRRWSGRGPNAGWWFEPADVERFVDECGWLYDVARMKPGHPVTRRAELAAKRDPWLTYEELAPLVGLRQTGNLDLWRERGLIPHMRRPKSGPGMRIMVRGRDVPAIRAAIAAARAESANAGRLTSRQTRRQKAAERASLHADRLTGTCRNGHPRTAETTTIIGTTGARICRACSYERRKEREAGRPARRRRRRLEVRVLPVGGCLVCGAAGRDLDDRRQCGRCATRWRAMQAQPAIPMATKGANDR